MPQENVRVDLARAWTSSKSLQDVLADHGGNGPGFETLRLALSILILSWHSILVSYGPEADNAAWQSPIGHLAGGLLPMFFALSGFLVMGSALRTDDLVRFMSLRGLRIVPALATEIMLSALCLGTIFTALPLQTYLKHPDFLAYFGSLIGRIRVTLPGVFADNPYPEVVNTSLWTIAPELLCYVFIAALILLRIHRSARAMTTIVLVLALFYTSLDLAQSSHWMFHGRPSSQLLLLAFAFGNLIYVWRDRIPYSAALFAACLVYGLVGVRTVGLSYSAMLCLSYCIVFLGLTVLPRIPILSRGDYSYGIYLYAFPVQQAVAHLLPTYREWYWNIALALPVTIALAAFSWTFIEKPALEYRKRLAFGNYSKSDLWPYAWKVALLSALLCYAAFLMRNAVMLPTAPLTAATVLEVFVGLTLVSALLVRWVPPLLATSVATKTLSKGTSP